MLNQFNFGIISIEEQTYHIHKGYIIELEGSNLFKLIHKGYTIAPFDDAEELCKFIKLDMQLNGDD